MKCGTGSVYEGNMMDGKCVKGMEESRGIGVGVMCGRCTCAFLSTYYSYA